MKTNLVLLTSLSLFLFACGSDDGVKAYNTDPSADITSHEEGAELLEGYDITFRGSVSDANHQNTELSVTWLTDLRELCPAQAPVADGSTTCIAKVEEGESQIKLQVVDPEGAAYVETINVNVQLTEAPTAQIVSPVASESYYSDQLILFSAIINDAEDDPADLTYTWTSNQDGELPITITPETSGEIEQYINLTQGQHAITLMVEDTSGKTTNETVAITVGGPNNDPSCAITEPVSDSVYVEGQSVAFAGTATDDDINNSLLSVSWESNIDGVFDTSSPFTDGTLGFSTSALSAGDHTISLKVEDEVGAVCSVGTQITIGTPPSLILNSPSDGDVVGLSDSIAFSATVSDQEDIASDISLSWYSDIDGEFSTQGSDSSGNISFSTSALTAGLHNIQVTATDTTGLTATTSFALRVNTAPPAPSISIDPDPAFTVDALNVIVTEVADADGDSISYSYEWFENGVATSYTSTTIPASETASGEIWMVRVTPNDTYTDGDYAEASVTISNSVPSVDTVSISPSSAYNDTTLTCSATTSDDDEVLTPSYEWTVGTSIYTGATLDLSTTAAMPTDVVTCTASVEDNGGQMASGSATVTLDNRPPDVPQLSLTPSFPDPSNDDLECTVQSSSFDDDGQSLVYSYEWQNDGTTTTHTTNIVPASDVGYFETWTCIVTAFDGIDYSIPESAEVTTCTFGDCDDLLDLGLGNGMDFVLINGGTFDMGSPEDEIGRGSDETQHEVSLTNNFYVSTTEVTQGMFYQLMGYQSYDGEVTTSQHGSYGIGDDYPAYYANWHMAAAFSNALTQYHNSIRGSNLEECYTCSGALSNISCSIDLASIYQCTGYRLLTEAEWEYSARAGTSTAIWTPNGGGEISDESYLYQDGCNANWTLSDGTLLDELSWFCGNYSLMNSSAPYGSKEVATKIENDYRLFDMYGNVREWVNDSYTEELIEDSTDPLHEDGMLQVVRGGLWWSYPHILRSSFRGGETDGATRGLQIGFRVSRTDNEGKPSAPEVSISPTSPIEGVDDLLCNIDSHSVDPDGGTISYTFEWMVDGVLHNINTTTTTYQGDTIPSSSTTAGETWKCIVTPSDGVEDGYSSIAQVNINYNCTYSNCDSSVDIGNNLTIDFIEIDGSDLDDPFGTYTLSNPFEIMVTEVTQEMYENMQGTIWQDGKSLFAGVGPDYPVYYISWHMAADYANELTELYNLTYSQSLSACYTCSNSGSSNASCVESMDPYSCSGFRLPTEYEWDIAARSGSPVEFWTGFGSNGGGTYSDNSCGNGIDDITIQIVDGINSSLSDYAWFCGNRYDSTYYNKSKPVANKLPNGFDLYDMHGNIFEWTAEKFGCSHPLYFAPWCSSGSKYIAKGGGWDDYPNRVVTTRRDNNYSPSSRYLSLGFRLVRSTP